MKKFLVSILALMMSFMLCFGLGGCDFLDKIFGKESSNATQEEEFDKTPYIGKYYFYSYTFENKETGEYEVHTVGDEGYSKTWKTFEIRDGSYEYVSNGTYAMGEWKKSSTMEDVFDFYVNGVLSFSAKIKDGKITITDKDSALNTKVIITTILVKE